MKNSGKILRVGFWIVLLSAVVIGFFRISGVSKSEHLKFVPAEADGVLVIDGKKISKKLIERFRYNPEGLTNMMPTDPEDIADAGVHKLGIDPGRKVAIFHFKVDGYNVAAALVKCEPRWFMNYFEDLHGDALEKTYENSETGVQIKRFTSTQQDVSICIAGGVGIYCSTVDGSILDAQYEKNLLPILKKALEKPEEGLIASNPSFAEFKGKDHDMGYWSVGAGHSFGALSNDFIDSQTFFSFDKGAVNVISELEFEGDCPVDEEIRKLDSDAPFAISFMAKRESAWSYIEENLPSRFHTYFKGFNGNFFFEITGHQLFQGYHIKDSIDELTFETYPVRIKNKELTPFPEFLAIFSVEDPAAYNAILDADTNIKCVDGFYEIEMIDGMTCFISSNENDICFSNSKGHVIANAKEDLDSKYATYSLRLDFLQLYDNFPVQGDMGIGVPNAMLQMGFNQLNFSRLYIDAEEIKGQKVIGKGAFEFIDPDQHSLDALMELASLGIQFRMMIDAIFHQSLRDSK